MTNNDVLRRIRYTFDLDDTKMMALFGLAGHPVTREQISEWLKKDEDPAFREIGDTWLAIFLNGLIIARRGQKEGPQPKPESRLTNNIIFRKLRIALNLQADDILEIMALADLRISKHELSAFFRKPGHKNYRECKDQILRNFLQGVQLKYHNNVYLKAGFNWNQGDPDAGPAAPDKGSETQPGKSIDKDSDQTPA